MLVEWVLSIGYTHMLKTVTAIFSRVAYGNPQYPQNPQTHPLQDLFPAR
jgi:hypothetical protein